MHQGLTVSSGRRYPVRLMRRSLGPLVIALLLASLMPPASAESRDPEMPTPALLERDVARGELDRATADLYLASALTASGDLPAAYRSDVPWRGTLPLLRLRERLAAMPRGMERRAIRDVLESSPGTCSGDTGATVYPDPGSTYFYIEYDPIGGGLNIDQYAASLDTSWNTEVNTFGWAAPPVAPVPAPGNKYHVVVTDLGDSLYGYVSNAGTHAGPVGNNPNTPWNDVDAQASCMVLNSDYTGFPSPPIASLQSTAAHEFAHSVQFGYGAITGANQPDVTFTEGLATWIEDEVFDAANDNYYFLWPDFTDDMGDHDGSPYAYWVVFRALTERYGTGTAGAGEQIMQDFWELTSQSTTSNQFPALNQGLVNKGTNLPDAYHAAAIALVFNRACGGGYVYPYCLEEGPAMVANPGNDPDPVPTGAIASVPGTFSDSVADNYALDWISLPTTGGPYNVTLQNTSAGGQLRATVACDTGSALNLSPLPAVVGAGASTTLARFSPSGCASLVAVITNQSQTADNPLTSANRTYTLSVSPPPPAPVTHQRQVSMRLRKHLQARGSVTASDGFASCLDGEAVQIQRRKRGGWLTVRTATTQANGSYRAKLPDKPGKYRSLLAESAAGPLDLCGAAQSAPRKHRHV